MKDSFNQSYALINDRPFFSFIQIITFQIAEFH